MKYEQLKSEDKKAYIDKRILESEQEHYTYSIELELAISARDVNRMVDLQDILNTLNFTLKSLHGQQQ